MSAHPRGHLLAILATPAILAVSAPAFAQAPPAPVPAPPAPVPAAPAPVPAAPAPKPRPVAAKPAKPPEPELPAPEVRFRVIAPSAEGQWSMRIENEGKVHVRVPADARLLHLTIEGGDTLAKKRDKAIDCKLPAGLRLDGFPEPRSLLLAPGDAYVESFDPRLFCFGKDARALEGGAIVRARFGWDAPKNAKKIDPPFAVQGTAFPAVVAPQKGLGAPTMVLSYEPADLAPPLPGEEKDEKDDKAVKPPAPEQPDATPAPKEDKPSPVVDENAAKLELSTAPYAEAATGARVTLSLKITNTGHRPALAAIRTRMVSFRVEGPDGLERCGAVAASRTIQREGYTTLKPGASTTLSILVEEACGRALFRRPGLYRVTPAIHLVESGAERGLAGYTGVARAKEPTLVRVHTGSLPFHTGAPRVIHLPKAPEQPADAAQP